MITSAEPVDESSLDLVAAALALARAFAAGATLWCVAPEWPSHARHVAVEFVHPVVIGKRALPAVSIDDPDLDAALRSVVRPGDVLLAVAPATSTSVATALQRAESGGLTTVWIGSGPRPPEGTADHLLWVDDDDELAPFDGGIVQRYHVLWEMAHVCLEHPGLLADHDGGRLAEATDFLYPFIEGVEDDLDGLLVDLAASAHAKSVQSADVLATSRDELAHELADTAAAMAERFASGGRLFVFGNGGSSTDAASITALFRSPPSRRPLPARCLVEDPAVLTALANDVGFDLVFSRQLIAHARPGDIALGLSTSGSSRNLATAFAEARDRGLLTVGLAGYDGGHMARDGNIEPCLVVRSDSVHRIQETQVALVCVLWTRVQDRLGVPGGTTDR